MGSQDNEKVKNTIDGISNAISGDGRKFVAELKNFLRNFRGQVDEAIKDTVTDVGEGTAEQLTNLSLSEVHVTDSTGRPQNNIQVDFDNTNVTNYRQAQIWMKYGSRDYVQVGTTSGVRYTIENVEANVTYTIKVIAVNKNGGTSKFDEAPEKSITIKGSVLIPDAPSQFFLTWDEDGALWQWQYEDNGYVDFFELRLDDNAGSYDEYLLDRTRNTYSRVAPPVRSGTGYLFVRNIFGTYSQPALHVFNKQLPLKPNPPALNPTLDGVVITMDALPTGYQGWILVVNDEEFKVYNRQFTYYQFSGEVTAKYAFFDTIGRSEWSDSVTAKAKVTIDKEQLPEISYDDFDQAIKDAIDSANNQAGINKDLEDSIGNVSKELEDMTADLNQSVEDLNKTIDDAKAEINQSINGVKGDIQSTQTSLNQSVNNLNSDISGIRTDVQGIGQSIIGIEAGIQQNANNITSLYASAQALDGKIASNTSLIQQTANSIETTVIEKVAVAKTEVVREVLDEIDDDLIAEVQKEVGSQVKQEAENITATVYEMVKDEVTAEAVAQVKIEADKIKSTVYEKTEVDGLLANKANKVDVYTKTETASQITQKADEITAMVNQQVESLDGKISANTSKITQTANEITSLVHSEIEEAEDRMSTDATSKVSQSATEIKALLNKEVTTLDGKISSNTSAITQSANEIKALVNSEVKTLDGKIASNTTQIELTKLGLTSIASAVEEIGGIAESNTSAITQNSNSITAITNAVNTIDGKVNENTSAIKIANNNITSAVSRIETVDSNVKKNTASIQTTSNSINSVVSSLNGTAENSDYPALKGLASSIVQTNNRITSVVTELNESPDKCKYSAITQLQNGIDLCVKDEDLNGNEIVSRINLTDGTVTIDGKHVHITGNTVFDNNVIVGGYIASDTINTDHLKTNSVTTAKIASNAITADKIKAGAITVDKITDKSITSTKIEDGAITTTKIVDGAVSTTKIEGGAITTDKIQAGSIIGEHISAGAVSADKLYAGDINMAGALALVGGAVRLDENGLTCSMNDGASTVFNQEGMTFFNANGFAYNQIRQMCIGYAEHGSTVTFSSEWSEVPSVVCMPTDLQVGVEAYSQANVFMICKPVNITKNGFQVQCYTKLGVGSISDNPIGENIEVSGVADDTYEYTIGTFNRSEATTIRAYVSATTYAYALSRWAKDSWVTGKWGHTCIIELLNDGELVASSGVLGIPAYPQTSEAHVTETNIHTVNKMLEGQVDHIGTVTLKVTLYLINTGSSAVTITKNMNLPIFIESFGYTSDEEAIISTGTALFMATTNSSSHYSVSNGTATTFGLRKQLWQG